MPGTDKHLPTRTHSPLTATGGYKGESLLQLIPQHCPGQRPSQGGGGCSPQRMLCSGGAAQAVCSSRAVKSLRHHARTWGLLSLPMDIKQIQGWGS